MPLSLSDKFCRTAPKPASGAKLHRDTNAPGLALRITASGSRSFVFCYSAPDGREKRRTIGAYGTWSLGAARQEAKVLRRAVDRGEDPFEERDARRTGVTLGQLWEWYREGELTRLSVRTQENVRHAFEKQILPRLGKAKRASAIGRESVQQLLDQVTKANGPVAANRMHSHLRKALNLAVAEGMIEENPAAKAIRRNREEHRERYLSQAEIRRLVKVLATHRSRPAATAIMLLLLTGARKSEVLSMEWSHLDLDTGRWAKPASQTKQRRSHHVPLSADVLAILRELHEARHGDRYVFPGRGNMSHRTCIKKDWDQVRTAAEIEDCRLHDLRHTFASVAISSGVSMEFVGALLGHTQASTTKRYAHLHDQPLRRTVNEIGKIMGGRESPSAAAPKPPPDDV